MVDLLITGAQDGFPGYALFGFEDIVGLGDSDFQDVVFSVRLFREDLAQA